MVSDPSTDEIVCWSENGETFLVRDEFAFSSSLLPLYFRHKNFSSFVRQLNFYGFHKRNHEGKFTKFYHQYFKRNGQDLLKKIKRKTAETPVATVKETISSLTSQVRQLQSQYNALYKIQQQILYIFSRYVRGHGNEGDSLAGSHTAQARLSGRKRPGGWMLPDQQLPQLPPAVSSPIEGGPNQPDNNKNNNNNNSNNSITNTGNDRQSGGVVRSSASMSMSLSGSSGSADYSRPHPNVELVEDDDDDENEQEKEKEEISSSISSSSNTSQHSQSPSSNKRREMPASSSPSASITADAVSTAVSSERDGAGGQDHADHKRKELSSRASAAAITPAAGIASVYSASSSSSSSSSLSAGFGVGGGVGGGTARFFSRELDIEEDEDARDAAYAELESLQAMIDQLPSKDAFLDHAPPVLKQAIVHTANATNAPGRPLSSAATSARASASALSGAVARSGSISVRGVPVPQQFRAASNRAKASVMPTGIEEKMTFPSSPPPGLPTYNAFDVEPPNHAVAAAAAGLSSLPALVSATALPSLFDSNPSQGNRHAKLLYSREHYEKKGAEHKLSNSNSNSSSSSKLTSMSVVDSDSEPVAPDYAEDGDDEDDDTQEQTHLSASGRIGAGMGGTAGDANQGRSNRPRKNVATTVSKRRRTAPPPAAPFATATAASVLGHGTGARLRNEQLDAELGSDQVLVADRRGSSLGLPVPSLSAPLLVPGASLSPLLSPYIPAPPPPTALLSPLNYYLPPPHLNQQEEQQHRPHFESEPDHDQPLDYDHLAPLGHDQPQQTYTQLRQQQQPTGHLSGLSAAATSPYASFSFSPLSPNPLLLPASPIHANNNNNTTNNSSNNAGLFLPSHSDDFLTDNDDGIDMGSGIGNSLLPANSLSPSPSPSPSSPSPAAHQDNIHNSHANHTFLDSNQTLMLTRPIAFPIPIPVQSQGARQPQPQPQPVQGRGQGQGQGESHAGLQAQLVGAIHSLPPPLQLDTSTRPLPIHSASRRLATPPSLAGAGPGASLSPASLSSTSLSISVTGSSSKLNREAGLTAAAAADSVLLTQPGTVTTPRINTHSHTLTPTHTSVADHADGDADGDADGVAMTKQDTKNGIEIRGESAWDWE